MAAEKNQRHLLVLMHKRICGIDPMKLITPEKEEEEAVDWENLPPFLFDFSVVLPLARMHALELDPKMYLVGDLVDPGKYLALSCERIGEKHLVCAFQVDELGVVIFQRLEGCLDRMPSFFHEKTPVMVDLDGKGTFVVILPGFAKEQEQDPVLCLLVLQLIAKKVVSYPSRVLRSSVRSPMECEFLDWKVLSMNMYSRKHGFDDWIGVSLFPSIPCDEAIAYEVPRRGKRKCSQI
ncbi:uncharacterized protein LOC130960486 [Arachis stenosperma]|uniref:uncharacterized protein LOC130960486 n=1 Tax=Arachis stenosperma TaxID=217475 RepID=UPI0025ABAC2C|nr:uncharacterized protein LOC130960486 [Arachis stenosperma]